MINVVVLFCLILLIRYILWFFVALLFIFFYIAYIVIACNICIQIIQNMQNIVQIDTKYIDNRTLHTSFSISLHFRPSALRHVPLFLIFVVFFPCFHFVLCNSITANLSCKKVLQIYITQYGWLGNSIASAMVIFIASRQT